MKTQTITASDGHKIYSTQSIISQDPKAIVLILHGLNEHRGRYIKFQNTLKDHGYISLCPDQRGHGQSVSKEYPLGHMGSLDQILQDQIQQIDYLREEYPDKDLFLFGHSFGSILARLLLKKRDKELKGLILSGTPEYRPIAKFGAILAKILSHYGEPSSKDPLLCKIGYGTDTHDLSWLSTDRVNIKNYKSDPNCQFYYSKQAYATIYKANCALAEPFNASNPDLPIASLVGSKDPVTGGLEGHLKSIKLLENSGYKEIKMIVYNNLGHEILNENCPKVYNDILKFIQKEIS